MKPEVQNPKKLGPWLFAAFWGAIISCVFLENLYYDHQIKQTTETLRRDFQDKHFKTKASFIESSYQHIIRGNAIFASLPFLRNLNEKEGLSPQEIETLSALFFNAAQHFMFSRLEIFRLPKGQVEEAQLFFELSTKFGEVDYNKGNIEKRHLRSAVDIFKKRYPDLKNRPGTKAEKNLVNFYSNNEGTLSFFITTPIFNDKQELSGVISSIYPASNLLNSFLTRNGDSQNYLLLNEDKQRLYTSLENTEMTLDQVKAKRASGEVLMMKVDLGDNHWKLGYVFPEGFAQAEVEALIRERNFVIVFTLVVIFAIVGWVIFAIDRYNALQEAFRKTDREKQKNETLLRVLSHDLSSPLSVIDMAFKLYHAPRSDDLKRRKMLDRIARASKLIAQIVDKVRNLQAVDSGKLLIQKESVEVDDIIDEISFSISHLCEEKNIKFVVENRCQGNTYIEVDPVIFQVQILQNLLSNAIKFSERDSKVELTVCPFKEKGKVTWQIRDSGIGIPKRILESIFDPSVATSRKGTEGEDGTGFGMPLVKSYLNAHGGEIEIISKTKQESPKNHGTTVTLKIDSKHIGKSELEKVANNG